MPDLSILMPVFNERDTVEAAISGVLCTNYPVADVEVIVIDDGSTDGTSELLNNWVKDPHITVVSHPCNLGKGAAVQTALKHARGTYAAIMDTDLEYYPADTAKLLEPILAGEAEIVYGSRGFESHSAFSFWYVVGNKCVALVANLLFNCYLSDVMTCHKVMRTETLRSLDLVSRGFEIEPEITGKLLVSGHQIYEVPVRYRARTRAKGKKLTAIDGVRVLLKLLECRLRGI